MKALLVEATLVGFSRKKDGSVKFGFNSMKEISNENFSLIDQYFQRTGWLAFKMDEFNAGDIPTEETNVPGQLSPSQTLRRALFAKHMQAGGTKDTFPAFYAKEMARFEQQVNDSY